MLADRENIWHLTQLDDDASDSSIGTLGLIRHDGVQLAIHFTHGKARHRFNEGGRGGFQLSKALGIKSALRRSAEHPVHISDIHVIDTTGGLGQDAWVIASMGCQVTVYESHPVVYALLHNALQRAGTDQQFAETASRITLLHADASDALQHRANTDTMHSESMLHSNDDVMAQAHAIYLDPMFPERRKSAGNKKGMQFLHELLGPVNAEYSSRLLHAALSAGARRVVVKRPKGAPALEGSDQWTGQRTSVNYPNTRYDVYHTAANSHSPT